MHVAQKDDYIYITYIRSLFCSWSN